MKFLCNWLAALLAFGFLLLSSAAQAQYQVYGDPFYGKINTDVFVLKTQYPHSSPPFTKVIEIDSGVFGDNEKVQVYFPYGQNGGVSGKVQQWQFIPAGRIDGQMSYYVINRWHRRYMEASGINGQVKAREYNGQLNQRWFFDEGFGLSQYFVRSAANGLYLTFPNSADGATLTMRNLNLSNTQTVTIQTNSSSFPIWNFNWNYNKPMIIHLADNSNLVFGDSGFNNTVQNQVIVLQNRVYGPTYQTWEPHTETWLLNNVFPIPSNLPGDDGFRMFKRWTNFTIAPWQNIGAHGYGITTRLWEPDPGVQQRWYVISSREDNQYSLVHAASGLTLQPQYSGVGALLVLVPFSTASSQRVTFTNLP